MQPVKSFFVLSTWMLRVSLLLMVYVLFFSALRSPDFSSIPFWIAAGFALFSMLLFIGAFMKKSAMTVVSALFLLLGCIYEVVMRFGFNKDNPVAMFFVFGAIALFFFSSGNKKK